MAEQFIGSAWFKETPGMRKRREQELADKIAFTTAQQNAAVGGELKLRESAQTQKALDKRQRQADLALRLMDTQGLSEPEAMLAARHQLVDIENNPDIMKATTARVQTEQALGQLPQAREFGSTAMQAGVDQNIDASSRAKADTSKRFLTAAGDVARTLAQDNAAEQTAINDQIAATAKRPHIGPTIDATAAAAIANANLSKENAVAHILGEPAAIRAENQAREKQALLNATTASGRFASAPEAAVAQDQAQAAQGRYTSARATQGMNTIAPQTEQAIAEALAGRESALNELQLQQGLDLRGQLDLRNQQMRAARTKALLEQQYPLIGALPYDPYARPGAPNPLMTTKQLGLETPPPPPQNRRRVLGTLD